MCMNISTLSTSFPFFDLARRMRVDYEDVLRYVDSYLRYRRTHRRRCNCGACNLDSISSVYLTPSQEKITRYVVRAEYRRRSMERHDARNSRS
jgi:hypothetical protein